MSKSLSEVAEQQELPFGRAENGDLISALAVARQNIVDHGAMEAAARAKLAGLPTHLVDTMAFMLGDESPPRSALSSLCAVTLPTTRPVAWVARTDQRGRIVKHRTDHELTSWSRANGHVGLTVTALDYALPTGEMCLYGLPWGTRARLLLLDLQAQAAMGRGRTVDLGPSPTAWLHRIGLAATGGDDGSLVALYDQIMRLCTSVWTLTLLEPSGTVRLIPGKSLVEEIDLTPAGNLHGRRDKASRLCLWPQSVVLTSEFYDSVRAHPVPYAPAAIKYLTSSALSLDFYMWLAQRLYHLKKRTPVSWADLMRQFGSHYGRVRDFRDAAKAALVLALAAYPEARIEVSDSALWLLPSPPAVPSR